LYWRLPLRYSYALILVLAQKGQVSGTSLQFRLGRREFPCHDRIDKTGPIMAPVAKRLVGGLAAAAQTDRGTTAQAERLALRVDDFNFAFHADGSIVIDDDFSWH